MSTNLSIHPAVERLRGERALLRQEFARAVLAARVGRDATGGARRRDQRSRAQGQGPRRPRLQLGGGAKLTPYARDILLVECHVAGTSHRDLAEVSPRLVEGQVLSLRRDPGNEYDPLAIRVFELGGAELGFVPRAKNEALARLMDAGKTLFGRIEAVTLERRWLRIEMTLYLRDH